MTSKQEKHLSKLLEELVILVSDKYRLGAKKHKGDLLSMSSNQLLEEAIMENIDQAVYLLTLKEKLSNNEIDKG